MSTLNVSIRVENLDKVREQLARLSGQQARQAYANALNDTGFQARKQMMAELGSRFDRVTPFIQKSPKVFMATAETLTVAIAPTLDTRKTWEPGMKLGGRMGVDPQQVLQAQEHGGGRRDKKSEVLLRQAGWLPPGYQTAIPKTPFLGSTDAFGNLKGPFIRSVLSYLQTYSEQGHYQNMKEAAIERTHRFGKGSITKRAQAAAGPFMGRRYFIAGGRAAVTWDNKPYRHGGAPTKHLQPGIWAVRGVGKSAQLSPVLLFVRPGAYRPRLDMQAIARSADLQNYLDKRVRARVRNLAEGKPA